MLPCWKVEERERGMMDLGRWVEVVVEVWLGRGGGGGGGGRPMGPQQGN